MSVPLIYDYMLHSGEYNFDCNWIQTPGRNRWPPFAGIHSFLIYLTSQWILPTVSHLTFFHKMKGAQSGRADARVFSSFTEGGNVDIPEFLRKKGRSRFPRAWQLHSVVLISLEMFVQSTEVLSIWYSSLPCLQFVHVSLPLVYFYSNHNKDVYWGVN